MNILNNISPLIYLLSPLIYLLIIMDYNECMLIIISIGIVNYETKQGDSLNRSNNISA